MLKIQDKLKAVRYLPALSFGIIAALSFYYQPLNYFLLLIVSFGIIPILELILIPSANKTAEDSHWVYDIILYTIPIIQYALLFCFLWIVQNTELSITQSIGIISSMGILCGVYGINAAHELGHRMKPLERNMAKALLLTSLYMHYHIEHNRGHHKKVGTLEDPATARFNEGLYAFWIRCIINSIKSAYQLESTRLNKLGFGAVSLKNEFIRFQFIQLLFVCFIAIVFGFKALVFFLISASIGILLLETINYIEHYGLVRKKNERDVYERIDVAHSWNSDHILGRYMLFELTRHSAHHENSLKKYPSLESIERSPQLPAGYPAMMILAFFPFAWKRIMNKRLIRS